MPRDSLAALLFHVREQALQEFQLERLAAGVRLCPAMRQRGDPWFCNEKQCSKQCSLLLPVGHDGDARFEEYRTMCGARTRGGLPCKLKPMKGKERCRYHGGASTGPKTAEGRQRIAAAQKVRWQKWREKKRLPS